MSDLWSDKDVENSSESKDGFLPLLDVKSHSPTSSSAPRKFDIALESVGLGFFHVLLIVVTGWALASDSVEVQCISFVTPQLDGQDDHDLNPSSVQEGALDAIIFLGMMVGGYFWGSWSDVVGRRSCLIASLTFNGVFGLASAFSPNYPWFLVFRFFSGVGVGGSIPVAFSYFCEFFTKKTRGPFVIILATFWVIGQIYTALLAWVIFDKSEKEAPGEGPFHTRLGSIHLNAWRIYIMLCTFPCLSSAFFLFLLPESPSFLYTKGRVAKAVQVLHRVNRINDWYHHHYTYRDHAYSAITAIAAEEQNHTVQKPSSISDKMFAILYATRELFGLAYLRPTLILIIVNFTFSFGYYGLMLWFPEYFKCVHERAEVCYSDYDKTCADLSSVNVAKCNDTTSPYSDSLYTALATIPGSVLGVFTINSIGARLMLAVSMIVSGLSTFLIWWVPKKESTIVILSAIFSGVSVAGWNALDVLFTSSLFPVHLRSTSIGLQTALGRIGAITGNLAFGALISVSAGGDVYVPILLVAVLLTFGGLTGFLLPSTKGEKSCKCSRCCRVLPCRYCVQKLSHYSSKHTIS